MSSFTESYAFAVVKRQWWVVLAVIVAAVAVALLMSSRVEPTYVGQSSVRLDTTILSKYTALLVGDKTGTALKSAEFYEFAAEKTGIPASEIKSSLRTSVSGKALDTVLIRFSSGSSADAQAGAKEMADVIVAYAYEVAGDEIARQQAVIDTGKTSIARIKTLSKQFADKPYELADIETRLTTLEQDQINNESMLRLLMSAYQASDSASVQESVGSNRTGLLAAALLAGLVVGLLLAAVREALYLRSVG